MAPRIYLKYQENPYLQDQDIYFYTILLAQTEKEPDPCTVGYCYLNLNPRLAGESGNIGYFIEEAYRGHSYSYQAALQLLSIAARKGQRQAVITCEPDNIASLQICRRLQQTHNAAEPVIRGRRLVFSLPL